MIEVEKSKYNHLGIDVTHAKSLLGKIITYVQ